MKEAYIYDAIRTPRGRGHAEKGALKDVKPVDLLKTVFQGIENRNLLDTSLVEEVVIGCNTVTGEQGANIAKIAALYAGWNHQSNGVTVSSFCTSGLEAIQMAAMKIMTDTASVAVAGGVESMSRVPMFSDNGPWFADRAVAKKTGFIHMGLAAEAIANLNGFTSSDLNDYTLRSHQNAETAWSKEYYTKDVMDVKQDGNIILKKDELIRSGLTKDKLEMLPMVFNPEKDQKAIDFIRYKIPELQKFDCLHTIGNAPGIADAASLILLGDKTFQDKIERKPIAKIIGFAAVAVDPILMLTGVVGATQKVLQKAGLKIEDIDLFEVNESFAAIPLMYAKNLIVSQDKINVNGGAIAMGHPLGATGGILIGSLIAELQNRGLKRGIATICAGAGIAQATLIEIVNN
ncbi:MAG: acetyl-CoA C-acyltransferase [Chitinophagales bacterium]